ncbi:MAG: hypothetical protein HRT38_08545 [Alteromonadaceae bacterium]|nr:hypothetical protein [Alteromonadaceae bacterium]
MFNYFVILLFFIVLSSCNPSSQNVRVTYKPICLASQSRCEVETQVGVFDVKFSVDSSVITEAAFNIEVNYLQKGDEVLKVNKISAYIEGKEMFMGKIPVLFSPSPSPSKSLLPSEKENHFVGETMLGSCSEEKMTWRLWITAEIENITTTETMSQTFFIEFDSTRV